MPRGRCDCEPGSSARIADLAPGDTLVVWKLDRLGRSLRHLLDSAEALRERGVALRSLTEHIDTGTAAGQMLYSVLGAVAQFERDVLRERTVAGLTAAKRRGEHLGRPFALTPAQVREAKKMLARGESPEPPRINGTRVRPSLGMRYQQSSCPCSCESSSRGGRSSSHAAARNALLRLRSSPLQPRATATLNPGRRIHAEQKRDPGLLSLPRRRNPNQPAVNRRRGSGAAGPLLPVTREPSFRVSQSDIVIQRALALLPAPDFSRSPAAAKKIERAVHSPSFSFLNSSIRLRFASIATLYLSTSS